MMKTLATASVLALGLSTAAAEAATIFATQIDVGRASVAGIGWDATVQTNTASRDDAGNALGAPDQVGVQQQGFFSLGLGQAAVFGFGNTFRKKATAFEVTFVCSNPVNGTCKQAEIADVYAFNGSYNPFNGAFGVTDLTFAGFSLVGEVRNGDGSTDDGATITIGGPFTYLALVDRSPGGTGRDGWDVDALRVTAVPVPAAGLLLIGALGGLAFWRRRKTV